MRLRALLALALVLLASAALADAEEEFGLLKGRLIPPKAGDVDAYLYPHDNVTSASFQALIRPDGSYSLRLPPGEYGITAACRGFVPDAKDKVRIEPGKTTDLGDWILVPEGVIAGRILLPKLAEGDYVEVYAFQRESLGYWAGIGGANARVDPKTGHYRIEWLREGSYDLGVLVGHQDRNGAVTEPRRMKAEHSEAPVIKTGPFQREDTGALEGRIYYPMGSTRGRHYAFRCFVPSLEQANREERIRARKLDLGLAKQRMQVVYLGASHHGDKVLAISYSEYKGAAGYDPLSGTWIYFGDSQKPLPVAEGEEEQVFMPGGGEWAYPPLALSLNGMYGNPQLEFNQRMVGIRVKPGETTRVPDYRLAALTPPR